MSVSAVLPSAKRRLLSVSAVLPSAKLCDLEFRISAVLPSDGLSDFCVSAVLLLLVLLVLLLVSVTIMPSAELCDVCLFQLSHQVLNFSMFVSVVLPSAELWYDCVIGTDDLERADGCYGQ